MKDFNGNSHAEKEMKKDKKDIKPVISSGDYKVSKTPIWKKMAQRLIAEDLKTAKTRVIDDVLIPDGKKLIVKTLNNLADRIFFGSSSRSSNSGIGNVSYRYNEYSGISAPKTSFDRATAYYLNDIIFPDRGKAEEVLLSMKEWIQMYDSISISDFYHLIEMKANYTDEKYGWKNLDNAETYPNKDGWSIRFPKIVPLV